MRPKILHSLIVFFVVLLSSATTHAVSLPLCSTTMDIQGIPSGSVSVSAETPITWNLKITGGNGFDAESYAIHWLSNPNHGSLSVDWILQSGHYAEASITYTPDSNYEPGDTENIAFKIVHAYGDCTSEVRKILIHDNACNGPAELLNKSWSSTPVTVNWGQSWGFYTDVHTWDSPNPPSYSIVQHNSLPNLGKLTSSGITTPSNGLGKRINLTYTHSEKSSGSDSIEFRIEDNTILDEDDRKACGINIVIPIKVNTKPNNFYCAGLDASITTTPDTLAPGGVATITVQGIAGSKSSNNFTYEVIGTQTYGSIPNEQKKESDSTSSSVIYSYTHDGNYAGNADTIYVSIKDAKYTECVVTKNIKLNAKNFCSGIALTLPESIQINSSNVASIPVSVSGGTGTYRYRITNSMSNGMLITTDDSGWVTQDSFEFQYSHNGTAYEGDTLELTVDDKTYGCTSTATIPVNVFNPCYGFGIGSNTSTSITMDENGLAQVTVYASKGNSSGQYIYSVSSLPSTGEVSPLTSGTTTASSFTFYYNNKGSDSADTFTVQVEDAENSDCTGNTEIGLQLIDYCEDFSATATPDIQTIDIGGTYGFTVTASGAGNQYSYSISSDTVLNNGSITSATHSGTISSGFAFTYKHDENKVNGGDTITVIATDTVYSCSVPVTVNFNMKNHCPSISYSVNYASPASSYPTHHLPEDTNPIIKYTIVGGSGQYQVDFLKSFVANGQTYIGYYGNLTEIDNTTTGNTTVISYEYDISGNSSNIYLKANISDLIYQNQNGTACKSPELYTKLAFDGSTGNTACAKIDLTVSGITESTSASTSTNNVNAGDVIEFTASLINYDPSRQYKFSHSLPATNGSKLILLGEGINTNSMNYRYTASPLDGGIDEFQVIVTDITDVLCEPETISAKVAIHDPSDSCNGSNTFGDNGTLGDVIIDSTASHSAAISSNLKFMQGCNRDQTTLGYKLNGSPDINGQGANVINIKDYTIVKRGEQHDTLIAYFGFDETTGLVESRQLTQPSQTLHYFSEGQHLFDLDHLRNTANWLSGNDGANTPNVTPRPNTTSELDALEPGTYGTITMQQFLKNIRDGKTMYGIVRVLIGLEKGTCEPNCSTQVYNGLGTPSNEAEIYGFCGETTTDGLCACSPSTRPGLSPQHHFGKIKPQLALCNDENGIPITLPDDAKIMVKGSLFWDFVDYKEKDLAGNPKTIPLASLPFFPRELYFMVDVPIVINSDYDDDYCGGIDYDDCDKNKLSTDFFSQMDYIKNVTNSTKPTSVPAQKTVENPNIQFSKVPDSSRDYYEFITGSELTSELFNELPAYEKYHLLMPLGYEKRWAEAFKHLQINAGTWKNLGYMIPSMVDDSDILTEDMLRSDAMQDVPVYLYSGGLVDMHSHVNVSGLVYVPQALEMEAETEQNIYQAIFGAVVVKDGYFIKAKGSSLTLISNYSNTYRSIKTANNMVKRRAYVGSGLEGLKYLPSTETSTDTDSTSSCLFCTNTQDSDGSTTTSTTSSNVSLDKSSSQQRRWQQIQPATMQPTP